jgi:DNA-binding GntR family transcriptional regulator
MIGSNTSSREVNAIAAATLANMINTSRETVTRALTALAQQGIVQNDSHRLIIVKPDALQKLVQG